MNVGISTACFYPMETQDTIYEISSIGANRCEVFFEAECEYKKPFVDLLKRKTQEYGVSVDSFHAFCASFEPQLFSDYTRRRKDALKVFEKAIRAGSMLGAKCYTFHGDKAHKTEEYEFYGKCFDELANIAGHYGVMLAWENVSWCQGSSPQFIKRVREYTKSDNLKYTLDIKQAKRAGVPIEEYLSVMNKNLINVHINDYNEVKTCLLPGEGQVDFVNFIKQLSDYGYDNNLIIEVYKENFSEKSQLIKSYNFIKSLI